MTINVLQASPLWITAHAARHCWASHDKSDTVFIQEEFDPRDGVCSCQEVRYCDPFDDVTLGEEDAALLDRLSNKFKHESIMEHAVITFEILGISRAALQQLARHRIQSLSVQSTRYVIQKLLKKAEPFVSSDGSITAEQSERAKEFLVFTGNLAVDEQSVRQLEAVRILMQRPQSNDQLKYALPESFKTSLVSTWNYRALKHFLLLRLDKGAMWELQDLASEIVTQLPDEWVVLMKDDLISACTGNARHIDLLQRLHTCCS